jgi:hypothetical protein
MYIPYGIKFNDFEPIQKRKRKLAKIIFFKMRKIFSKLRK